MNSKKLITSALLLVSVNTLAAGGFAELRCASWGDNLNQPQAAERWKWAMRCDVANSRILWTYREYTAPGGAKRPAYPIYGLIDEDYKKEPSNPLKWFPPKTASADCYIPENYDIIGFCAGGCYTADQLILVDGSERSIKDMISSGERSVMTLDEDSTTESIRVKDGSVFSYMKSVVSGPQEIISLETDSGKKLSITLEHPLVSSTGEFILAEDLSVGSKLLNEFGDIETVSELSRKEIDTKVYNLRTNGANETDRVVVAQGLLNGDLSVQQRKAKKANQFLLRKKIIRGELIK
mgnify:CR=1 FL=1